MNLAADPEMAEWVGNGPALQWDAGNDAKSSDKHGFSVMGVESMFRQAVFLAGRIVRRAHDEPRWLLLGVTMDGRRAALIFTRRGDQLRPISCRAMRTNEKEAYDAATHDG
jgi:hypothetical protein